MTIGLYAGSFDPITLGHLDIIISSSEVFEKVIIGVAVNPDKNYLIPTNDRVKLIKECTKNIPNIEVYSFDGLTADFAKKHKANVLIRGLRNTLDFEYEKELAMINYDINDSIKTVFLMSKSENSYISSSAVKELINHKSDITKYVPVNVVEYLYQKKFL